VSSSGPVWQSPWLTGDTVLSTVSNALQSGASRGSGVIYPVSYGPNCEVAVTMAGPISGSELVLLAFSNGYGPFPDTYGDGNFYAFVIQPGGGGTPGTYHFEHDIGTVATVLIDGSSGFTVGPNLEAGVPEQFAFSLAEEATGTRCRLWRMVSGTWTQEANVLDTDASRPSGQRYAGVEMTPGGSAMRLTDFVAGTTLATSRPPQGRIQSIGAIG
jgi:hypothetical protein